MTAGQLERFARAHRRVIHAGTAAITRSREPGDVPAETRKALAAHAETVPSLRSRKATPPGRRERDRHRCRYPGCESRRVDAHHIRYWSNGGQTNLGNLISLCQTQH